VHAELAPELHVSELVQCATGLQTVHVEGGPAVRK
jgi:hypothetical protein